MTFADIRPPLVIAQASDSLSGGAGWVGAGLLGLVLAWLLLKHLPAKDEQLKEIYLMFQTALTSERAAYRVDLERILGFQQRENSALADRVIVSLDKVDESLNRLVERK